MKKGQIVEGIVVEVNFPNKGIVEVVEQAEDKPALVYKVAVKGVLPGQKVKLAIKKARKEKCQGRLLEVLEMGQLESRKAACPYFGACGGCNYQCIPYENQLGLKKEQVLKLIDAVYEGEGYRYDDICSSPSEWEYRNKMEFSFGDEVKDGPLTLGLHKKGSFHDIVDVEGCKIIHEDYSKILSCIREYAMEVQWPHYKKRNHEGLLRHLLVRRSYYSKEILVALVTSSQMDIDLTELSDKLKGLSLEGEIAGFLHIINDSLGDVVQSDETRLIFGQDYITEQILGLSFKISPFSFFQTNTRGAEVLYQRARQYILEESNVGSLEGKTVFDLYSGTGTIAQVIAPVAGKVIGVEIVAEAVEAAKENAARNGLANCEFIAGDVLKVLDDIKEKPDFIILDPPRDGIHPKALQKIIDYGVENIVYISCKPTSFARDLEVFQQRGYALKRVSNVDLFPQTVHVESVVLMSKVNTVKG